MIVFDEKSKDLQIPVGIGKLPQDTQELIELAYCEGCEDCSGGGGTPFDDVRKHNTYLYSADYSVLDYEDAKERLKDIVIGSRGCTALNKGGVFARNYDWYYDDTVSFVIRTPKNGKRVNASAEEIDDSRYATIGVAGGIPELTTSTVEDYSNEIYKVLPFMLVDGMNEKGVVISTNLVPDTYGKTTHSVAQVEERDFINAIMLPRYILDNFSTAYDSVTYIRDYVSVHMPESIQVHYLVSDSEESYVLEFIGNSVEIIKVGENEDLPSIITNFHLKGVELVNGHADYFDSNIEDYGQGLERYNIANDAYESVSSVGEAIILLQRDLRFTNAYDASMSPLWKTEFTGYTSTYGDLSIKSPIEDFEGIMEYARELYENRSRYEGRNTWKRYILLFTTEIL